MPIQLDPVWAMIAQITEAVLVMGAIAVGAFQWRKQMWARSLDRAEELLRGSHKDVRHVMTHDYSNPTAITPEDDEAARNVVATFSHIHQQIEWELLPQRLVFGKCYSTIIRAESQLRNYMRRKERLGGSRYGRRFRKLARWARRYHDAHPRHRLDEKGDPIEIWIYGNINKRVHRTKQMGGWRGWMQRLEWGCRRLFNNYTEHPLPAPIARLFL